MSYLDDLVAQSLQQQADTFKAQIKDAHDIAQNDIIAQSVALGKQEDALAGFKNGITPPAYATNIAGVLVRDPFGGITNGDAAPLKDHPHNLITEIGGIILLYIAYVFIFKKGKFHGFK